MGNKPITHKDLEGLQSTGDNEVKNVEQDNTRVIKPRVHQSDLQRPSSDQLTVKEKAENAIISAAKEKNLNYVVETGEAAFYGPKLDFMVKDALGRSWQLGTIQVDYNLPERFELTYKGSDNELHRPVMIHRAPSVSYTHLTLPTTPYV